MGFLQNINKWFKDLSAAGLGFAIVFIFVTFWVIALVSKPINIDITADITEELTLELTEATINEVISGCTSVLGLAEGSTDFNFCEERIRKGFALTDFKASDCSLCGPRPNFPNEEGLCLTGPDVPFCESSAALIIEVTEEATAGAQDLPIAQFGNAVTAYTDFFDRIVPERVDVLGVETNAIILWIIGLAVLGFLLRFMKVV